MPTATFARFFQPALTEAELVNDALPAAHALISDRIAAGEFIESAAKDAPRMEALARRIAKFDAITARSRVQSEGVEDKMLAGFVVRAQARDAVLEAAE